VLCVDEKVRHEALLDSSGVEDPAAGPPQRPGGSWGQPDPGAAGEGGKRPWQRRVAEGLPDFAGAASKTERRNASEPVSEPPQATRRL